jgi:predicted transcriptional regulator
MEQDMSENSHQIALEIVKAQASVRPMSEEEIVNMVIKLTRSISSLGVDSHSEETEKSEIPANKGIRANSVLCLECGKTFKLITTRHLASHGLTPAEYREKYGFKRKEALVCKNLQKVRKEKMKSMQLWTRRGAGKPTEEEAKAAKPIAVKVRVKRQAATAQNIS